MCSLQALPSSGRQSLFSELPVLGESGTFEASSKEALPSGMPSETSVAASAAPSSETVEESAWLAADHAAPAADAALPIHRDTFADGAVTSEAASSALAGPRASMTTQVSADSMLAEGWLVLRSLDEADASCLMDEADGLDFSESDAWRESSGAAVTLAQRPSWPPVGYDEPCLAARHQATSAVAASSSRLTRSQAREAATAGLQALRRRRQRRRELEHAVPEVSCDMVAVLAQSLVPVLKLCAAVGVELTLRSPALISSVGHAQVAARSQAPAHSLHGASTPPATHAQGDRPHEVGDRCAHEERMLARVRADSAGRALSHVLDASMQRIGHHGRVRVNVCHSTREQAGLHERSLAVVNVTVSDTGVSAAAELEPWIHGSAASAPGAAASQARRPSRGAPHASSAEAAMSRMKAGLPVGNGCMSLQIAERFVAEQGGVLSVAIDDAPAVGQGEESDERWVHTTVSFPVP
jgi:hypothetical protein